MNHAVYTAAVTQIRYRHGKGHAYYDKKIAEVKQPKRHCDSNTKSATLAGRSLRGSCWRMPRKSMPGT